MKLAGKEMFTWLLSGDLCGRLVFCICILSTACGHGHGLIIWGWGNAEGATYQTLPTTSLAMKGQSCRSPAIIGVL